MRTSADDLAADVAELYQLIQQQCDRVKVLQLQYRAAENVLSHWQALRKNLETLAQLRRGYATAEQAELEYLREQDTLPF